MFFNYHTDDITAFAYFSGKDKAGKALEMVATGELGKTPFIFLWCAKTMKKLGAWKGVLQNGVSALAFSPDGNKLAAVGADQKHHVAVLDVKKKRKSGGKGTKGGVLGKQKGGPDPILDVEWSNDSTFMTCGPKNAMIWTYQKSKDFKKPRNKIKSGFDNKLFCSVYDPYGKQWLVGTKNGFLQMWAGETVKKEIKGIHVMGKKKLKKPLDAIAVTENYILTGGRDNCIQILDRSGKS